MKKNHLFFTFKRDQDFDGQDLDLILYLAVPKSRDYPQDWIPKAPRQWKDFRLEPAAQG